MVDLDGVRYQPDGGRYVLLVLNPRPTDVLGREEARLGEALEVGAALPGSLR